MLRLSPAGQLMSLRLSVTLCGALGMALGSAQAQSALTPPRPQTQHRPAINSQDVGNVMKVELPRVPRLSIVLAAPRPAPFLRRPRIPAAPVFSTTAEVADARVAPPAPTTATAPNSPAPPPRAQRVERQAPRARSTPAVKTPPAASAAPIVTPTSASKTQTQNALASNTTQGTAWAHVTYLSGESVYLDAGTKQGLKIGTHLDVLRGSTFVAQLVVEYVSSNRASCRVVKATLPPAVGDSARYEAAAVPEERTIAAQANSVASNTSTAKHSNVRPVRGRIGVRYLRSDPGLGQAAVLIRPAFDLRADGHQMNGTPIGLTLDVRAYRDRRAGAAGSPSNVTRVYQGLIEVSPPGSTTRFGVGRQFSTALTSIGIFDGVALDVDRSRWSTGALAGSQPEPGTFGLSGEVREYGAYVQLHNERNTAPSWSTTLGAVGSYVRGQIDREFAYLQTTFTSQRLTWYVAQELDVNRGWKSDAEGSAVSPTSTFGMLRVGVTQDFQLNVGYDSRRTVRLYRDFLTPEIEFDDSFRRGAWGGASLTAFGRVRASADARRSSGGPAGVSESYTGMLSISRLTPLQLGVRGRGTQYNGQASRGSLALSGARDHAFRFAAPRRHNRRAKRSYGRRHIEPPGCALERNLSRCGRGTFRVHFAFSVSRVRRSHPLVAGLCRT